jgi:Ca2+-binding EF-hand superfamily protein
LLPGPFAAAEGKKALILRGFSDGTAFAEYPGEKVRAARIAAIAGALVMMFALGAAASAIDGLFGLVSPKQTQSAGSGQDQPNLFAFRADAATNSAGTSAGPAAGGSAQISPETMSALLAAQSQSGSTFARMSRQDALKDLFSKIDADGDGKITKSEFENALGAGGTNLAQADDVFGKLDKDGDGSVSLDEMSSALKGGRGRHHGHHHMANDSGDDSSDPLLQALQGTSGTTVTNADGSTTTSLTYADGSTVTMTKPAASSASSASTTATSSYNFIEQLIQRQANAISAQASSSLSVSV